MKHLTPLNESEQMYSRNIPVEVNYSGSDYLGKEINYISASEVEVFFYIQREERDWGIKGMSIYGIKGPGEIILDVVYYETSDDENYDEVENSINLKIDWNKIKIEEEKGAGILTVDRLEINLSNDPEGGFAVAGKDLRKTGELIHNEIIVYVSSF